jgi:TRAP-type C4-dicarboxylate transport system permease small subunit
MIRALIGQMNRWLAEICGLLLIVMIIFLCIDIFGRLLSQPIQGIPELAVFVMIAVVYLGLAQCEQQDKHIKVTAFYERMPPRIQRIVKVINVCIQFLVASILIWAAYKNFLYTYSNDVALSGTVLLVLWPVRLIILFGLIFYWLQTVLNLNDWIRQFFKTDI